MPHRPTAQTRIGSQGLLCWYQPQNPYGASWAHHFFVNLQDRCSVLTWIKNGSSRLAWKACCQRKQVQIWPSFRLLDSGWTSWILNPLPENYFSTLKILKIQSQVFVGPKTCFSCVCWGSAGNITYCNSRNMFIWALIQQAAKRTVFANNERGLIWLSIRYYKLWSTVGPWWKRTCSCPFKSGVFLSPRTNSSHEKEGFQVHLPAVA